MTVRSSKNKQEPVVKAEAPAEESVASKAADEIQEEEAPVEESPTEEPKAEDVAKGTEVEVKDGDAIMVSKSDLASLIDNAVNKKISNLKATEAMVDGRIPVLTTEDIDEEDFLDVPIVFFAYSVYFAIFDDVKQNRAVMPPYLKPIRFKLYQRYTRGQGIREKEMISISCVRVQSQKIVDFLRDHTLYGVRFFEDVNQAKEIDVSFAEKMTETVLMLNKFSQFQVIERVKRERENGHSIEISADIKTMRKQLAKVIVDGEMKRMGDRTREMMNEGTRDNPKDRVLEN